MSTQVRKKTLGFQVDALVQHTQMVEVDVPEDLTGKELRAFLEKEAAAFVAEECFTCYQGITPSVVISGVHLLSNQKEEEPMATQPIPRTTEPIGMERGNTPRRAPEPIIPQFVVVVRDGAVVEVKSRYEGTICRVIDMDRRVAENWEANPLPGNEIEKFTQYMLNQPKERN